MCPKRASAADSPDDAALLHAWLTRLESENTRSSYRADLRVLHSWCSAAGTTLLSVDRAGLRAFQAARRAEGDSDATMRRRLSAVTSFYRFAVDEEHRSSNPAEGLTRPTTRPGNPSPTEELSADTVRSLLEQAAAIDRRLDALVSLMALDGVKLGEALAIDIEDLRGRPPTSVTIRRRGEPQRVALSRASAEAVRRCAGRRRDQPLFTSHSTAAGSASEGAPRLTRFGADHLFRHLAGTGGRRVTSNTLRRYYIASLHRAGMDVSEVRTRAGLGDRAGVQRYLPTEP